MTGNHGMSLTPCPLKGLCRAGWRACWRRINPVPAPLARCPDNAIQKNCVACTGRPAGSLARRPEPPALKTHATMPSLHPLSLRALHRSAAQPLRLSALAAALAALCLGLGYSPLAQAQMMGSDEPGAGLGQEVELRTGHEMES